MKGLSAECLQAVLLGLAMMLGQVLERNKIDWMSEAGGALLMGIVVGLILNVSNISTAYEDVFRFNVRSYCSGCGCKNL